MTELTDLKYVVEHELFPDVDMALRRGRHVDREDAAWYAFLSESQAELELFYRRYGAELIQRPDGFFFLLPSGDRLGRRHLSPGEMLVGQGLTLLYLDPTSVEQGGVTTREQLLSQLSAAMGTDALISAFNPKRRRHDERFAQETVRTKVSEAIRRLASLGFVTLLPGEGLRLRASLMRFAEPVRGSAFEAEALARLVASGEVVLGEDTTEPDEDDSEKIDDGLHADAESSSEIDADPEPVRGAEPRPAGHADEPAFLQGDWQAMDDEWGSRFDVSSIPRGEADEPPEREP